MTTEAGQSLLATFDRIRIINLKVRNDRRREVSAEFGRLDLRIDGTKLAFHEANRPTDAGGFQSIGARGCFFSHFEVLEAAMSDGVESVLIMEDDLDFSKSVEFDLPPALGHLRRHQWDVFYGGLLGCSIPDERDANTPLSSASPDNGIQGTHFVALSKAAISLAVPYLDEMARRPPGSMEGGPMHVDGAYSWLRRAYPGLKTWLAAPELGHQRPSRTDIHELGFIDKTPVVRDVAALARRLKRHFH
jgi:hypothetical protein